jgi:hypothetical protein
MARYWFYDVYKTKEVALMNADELKGLRLEKDQFFKSSPHSPLSPDQQDAFQGLRYFEYNPALTLEVAATRLSLSPLCPFSLRDRGGKRRTDGV